jgi:hypothetical protein
VALLVPVHGFEQLSDHLFIVHGAILHRKALEQATVLVSCTALRGDEADPSLVRIVTTTPPTCGLPP